MNINANELLLLSKKIKFGQGVNPETATVSSDTAVITKPETESPQTGLNSLMFQGLKNVASDPQLATEVKIKNNTNEEANTKKSADEYVAPFKSNLAFQGKASKMKSVAMAALMGLATLGTVSTMTSCEDDIRVSQSVEVDLSAIMEMVSELKALRQELNNSNKEMAQKYDQLISMFNQVMTLMQQQHADNTAFQMILLSNQELIIDLMVANGEKQDEATAKLDAILKAVENGSMTIEQALNKITNLVNDIKDILGLVLDSLQKADKDRATLITLANSIKESSNITNEQQKALIAQNDSLIASNKEVINQLTSISTQIEQSRLENSANFDAVVQTLNMNASQLIQVMEELGYAAMDIRQMTAAEILAAIKENTTEIQNTNNGLQNIKNEIESGKISAQEAADKIINLLEEINSNIIDLTDSFNSFVNDYQNDKQEAFKMLSKIIKNGKVQTSILESMNETQQSMSENIKGIKENTDKLLNIAQDNTKYDELINTIKSIQISGGSSIDYKKFEEMFKMLNISLSEVVNMSRTELVKAIKDFENTYINVEQKQTEELQTIGAKIDDLQIFIANNVNGKDIVDAIGDLTIAVNNGNSDVTAELKTIEAQLDKLQKTVDAIYKSIGDQASKANVYFQRWDAKFDAALGDLKDIKTKLSQISSNQKTAESYLKNLNIKVDDVITEIKNLNGIAGGDIDYDKLDQMWKEHDAANYEKFKALIDGLGVDLGKIGNINELLESINAKMVYIQDNSDILNKILEKLNGIDWTKPDYSAKLDKIIELLQNFEHNCQCGNNNEGILGDLDDILK